MVIEIHCFSHIQLSMFFKKKSENNKTYIWDPFRKKYVVLTPEEEVRHALLAFMVEKMTYPVGLISVEKQIAFNGMRKRYDIVVYRNDGKPWLLAECKQPGETISQKTIQQAATYNIVLQSPFLVVSNGHQHFVVKVDFDSGSFEWLNELPIMV